MTPSGIISRQLRVTSVRSRGAFGGVIFAGKDDLGASFVVKADHRMMPDASVLQTAQVWDVAGHAERISYVHNGLAKSETQIKPTRLVLQRPSGKSIVAWIAQSPDCRGIGEVKARRLYELFGIDLVSIIEAGDADSLSAVVGHDSADSLIAAFAKHGVAQMLVWLEQMGLPNSIAASVARYWGKDAQSKVEANPYVLVSFCADWKQVDAIAITRFGVANDDHRRLIGAAEEALYRVMQDGDTAAPTGEIITRLAKMLGTAAAARNAIALAIQERKAVSVGDQLQAPGLAYIENYIARILAGMLCGEPDGQGELFRAEMPVEPAVLQQLAEYEASNGVELTAEQRRAVVASATSPLSLILGGAGTGKTTVLKALCFVLASLAPEASIHQFALAGRAAQRIAQATGRPAFTIAAFLNGIEVAPGATVLIDEVSMVDAILMYRVLKELPAGVRLVLVGDPAQLPPIGPGLVVHALDGLNVVPQTVLQTVKRQSSASGIPQVAAAVRQQQVPRWADYVGVGNGVAAVRCEESCLDEAVAEIYQELGGTGADFSVQILSSTKNGPGGVRNLNALIHKRFGLRKLPVQRQHPDLGLIYERTEDNLGLFADDLVIFGANDYSLGLRNGSLGRIQSCLPASDGDASVCVAEFEGSQYKLTATQIQHIAHAYSITIHKAQGSQFARVIVPIRKNKLLDNSLLYTAITRGVEQVVLVGDIDAAQQAILASRRSTLRNIRLGNALLAAMAPSNH